MIICFSTSSPLASVAILASDGDVLWSGSEVAPRAASGACMTLLERGLTALGLGLADATMIVADLGPGSFTGVRVGVTLAKTLAFAQGVPAGGLDAFDLIDPSGTVVIPSKRGEWFIREPGVAPKRSDSLPSGNYMGWGTGLVLQTYPDACRFAPLMDRIVAAGPEFLVPAYLIEPSISLPKTPYGAGIAQ